MSETSLVQQVRLGTADIAVLFRNNQGKFQDKNGRWITFGVCNPGGSDLIGWRHRDAKFIGLEIKLPGNKPTPAQINFLMAIQRNGGIAGVATSVEEARKIILGEQK